MDASAGPPHLRSKLTQEGLEIALELALEALTDSGDMMREQSVIADWDGDARVCAILRRKGMLFDAARGTLLQLRSRIQSSKKLDILD